MLLTRVRSFCIRRSPIRRFPTPTRRHVSSNRPETTNLSWKYLPKSGNDWTFLDLESYNISINQVDPLQFFGLQELPEPAVDQELLNFTDPGAMQQVHHAQLMNLLDLAVIPREGETAVCDFSVKLLEVMGYVSRERVARTQIDLPLFVCDKDWLVKNDVCIVDRGSRDDIILVLREDRDNTNTRARLIAEGLAAFSENEIHRDAYALPPLEQKVIPGIVMIGTLPTFFKIPVTQSLLWHVGSGMRPPTETRVTYCYPPVPARRRTEGMRPVNNRREILKCFEAFKAIVGI